MAEVFLCVGRALSGVRVQRVQKVQKVQRVVVAADAADYKKPARAPVISTEAKRSGEISPL